MFILRAQPRTQSLFLFPIVFGINLIHFFFSWEEGRCRRKFDRLFRRGRNFLATGSVNSLRISASQWWPFKKGETGSVKGETKSANFWQRKVKTVTHRQVCEFLARESVNSSPILARQWWRHFRLSLSLSLSLCISLSLSLSHRAHLTHNIWSASALPIIIKNVNLDWLLASQSSVKFTQSHLHLLFLENRMKEHWRTWTWLYQTNNSVMMNNVHDRLSEEWQVYVVNHKGLGWKLGSQKKGRIYKDKLLQHKILTGVFRYMYEKALLRGRCSVVLPQCYTGVQVFLVLDERDR